MKNFCFIFLGNPGREYEKTRHNFAWMLADAYCNTHLSINWADKFEGKLYISELNQNKIYWFKPQQYMNLSGIAVRKLLDFYKLSLTDLIVFHDDLELPFGQIAFKVGGGAGGHNGLRSLDQHLGSNAYIRCRLGIGRPKHGDVSSFVLSRFTEDEEICLPLVFQKTLEELDRIIAGQKLPQSKIQTFQEINTRKK